MYHLLFVGTASRKPVLHVFLVYSSLSYKAYFTLLVNTLNVGHQIVHFAFFGIIKKGKFYLKFLTGVKGGQAE